MDKPQDIHAMKYAAKRTNDDYRIHCGMNDFHKDNKMRRDKA